MEKVLMGAKGAVAITRGDCARLDAGELLNDSVIDCYLKCVPRCHVQRCVSHRCRYRFVQLRFLDQPARDAIHVFSSLFYKRLTDVGCRVLW